MYVNRFNVHRFGVTQLDSVRGQRACVGGACVEAGRWDGERIAWMANGIVELGMRSSDRHMPWRWGRH